MKLRGMNKMKNLNIKCTEKFGKDSKLFFYTDGIKTISLRYPSEDTHNLYEVLNHQTYKISSSKSLLSSIRKIKDYFEKE